MFRSSRTGSFEESSAMANGTKATGVSELEELSEEDWLEEGRLEDSLDVEDTDEELEIELSEDPSSDEDEDSKGTSDDWGNQ